LVRHAALDVTRILVLPQTLIDHLTKQIIVGPAQVCDLDHKLRSDPMHPVEHERFGLMFAAAQAVELRREASSKKRIAARGEMQLVS
jgi:hypothetical protein